MSTPSATAQTTLDLPFGADAPRLSFSSNWVAVALQPVMSGEKPRLRPVSEPIQIEIRQEG